MKTYVISGATGFIGRALTELLLARGERVIALVHRGSKRLSGLEERENFVPLPLDLNEFAAYVPTVHADVFFHLAWAKTAVGGRDDAKAQVANIAYTTDAVELAARFGCSVFVGAGSQAEYGIATAPLRGDSPADPQSGYGIAKYAAGKLSRLRAGQLGLRHCWVRILSVYGKGDGEGTLISYLIRTLYAGEVPELSPCEQIWDYLHVTDAARALAAVADHGKDGSVYPLGSGKGHPLREYVECLRDIVAPGADIRFGAKPYYPHQPMLLTADIGELTRDTGFVPSVSFAEGIRQCCPESFSKTERNE